MQKRTEDKISPQDEARPPGPHSPSGQRGPKRFEKAETASFAGDTKVVPPHTKVDCESGSPAEAVLDEKAVVVFDGMTPRVALCDLATVGNALQEVTQTGKAESSSKRVVLGHGDCRPP